MKKKKIILLSIRFSFLGTFQPNINIGKGGKIRTTFDLPSKWLILVDI